MRGKLPEPFELQTVGGGKEGGEKTMRLIRTKMVNREKKRKKRRKLWGGGGNVLGIDKEKVNEQILTGRNISNGGGGTINLSMEGN